MECPFRTGETKGLLLDYCSHTLDAKAMADVEKHLAECPHCRAWTDAHTRTWMLLDEWEPAPVSPDFERKLRERVAAEGARTSKWKAIWVALTTRPLKPAIAVAAAVVLLIVGLLFVRPKPAPTVQRAQEVMDADHLEKALDDVDMLRQLGVATEKQDSGAM